MKAWHVESWREPEEMAFRDLPVPEPAGQQVVIRVVAAGLNFMDALMIRGAYQVKPPFPFTPGIEVSGVVEKAGRGSAYQSGDRVCAILNWGGFAEYALAEDQMVIPVPDTVDLVESCAIPAVYPTSYSALKMTARLRPGETVLVHAGAGGVGTAAIQLARTWGARVIATAGSAEKLRVCREQGAEPVYNYETEDWVNEIRQHTGGKGVDVIYDPIGGVVTGQSVRCLAWRGRLLIVGFASGHIPEIPANRLLLKNAAAMGVFWGNHLIYQPRVVEPVYRDLFAMLCAGQIQPVISQTRPLREAPQAIRDMADRKTWGKVLLIP